MNAVPVVRPLKEFTLIFVPPREDIHAFPVYFAILELPLVHAAIREVVRTEPVGTLRTDIQDAPPYAAPHRSGKRGGSEEVTK